MPGSRAVIVIDARDNASIAFNQVQQAIKRTGTVTQQTSQQAGLLSGAFGKLTGVVTGFIGAYAGMRGLQMVQGLAMLGAQAEITEQSFRRMIASVGINADILDKMKAAAAGTVPEMQLMQALNTSLIGTTQHFGQMMANAYPQLIQIARAASIANPSLGDMNYMIRSLSIGLKRMSPLILDNLGLQLKLGDANKAYAAQLGKTTDALTTEEKQIALLNATMEAGDRLVNQVGVSTDNAITKTQTLTAAMSDLNVEIGRNITFLLDYHGILAQTAQLTTAYIKNARLNVTTTEELATEIKRLKKEMPEYVLYLEDLEDRLGKLAYEQGQGEISAIAYADGLETVRSSLKDITGEVFLTTEAIDRLNKSFTNMSHMTGGEGLGAFITPKTLSPINLDRLMDENKIRNLLVDPYAELQNAAPYGGWEAFYDEGQDAATQVSRILIDEQERAAEQSARAWERQMKSAWNDITGKISGIMTPTMPEAWWKGLLPRKDEWDEEARRAADVVNLGEGSPWFQHLMETFPTFKSLVEKMGVKEGSAAWVDQFYKFMDPSAINTDRIKQQYTDMMTAAFNKEQIVNAIAADISAGGGTVNMDVLSALVAGKPELALIAMSGEDLGTSMVGGYEQKIVNSKPVGMFADTVNSDLEAQRTQLLTLGNSLGGVLVAGITQALVAPDFINELAGAVSPRVAEILGQNWGR